MHNITLRRISTAAIAGVATVAVLAPAASASTADLASAPASKAAAAKPLPKRLTVQGYLGYLGQNKSPEARSTLKAFKKLPKAKQVKFVNYLQDRTVYKALTASLKGSQSRDLRVVTPFNTDVKFVKDVKTVKSKDKLNTTKITFTVTERIYNIPVTSEQVWVKYQAKKGNGSVAPRAGAKATNVNAAFQLRHGKVEARKIIGGATGATVWTATPRYQSFGKKPVVKAQSVDGYASSYWKASLANR